jgi:hypothetical protein
VHAHEHFRLLLDPLFTVHDLRFTALGSFIHMLERVEYEVGIARSGNVWGKLTRGSLKVERTTGYFYDLLKGRFSFRRDTLGIDDPSFIKKQ